MIISLGFAVFVTYWLAKRFKRKPPGVKLFLTYVSFFVGVGLLGLAAGLSLSYYAEVSSGLVTQDSWNPLPLDVMSIFLVSGAASLWVIKTRVSKIKAVEVGQC